MKAHVQDMSVASEQGMWWPAVAKTVFGVGTAARTSLRSCSGTCVLLLGCSRLPCGEPALVMPEFAPLSGSKRSLDRRGCVLLSQIMETPLFLIVSTYYIKYFGKRKGKERGGCLKLRRGFPVPVPGGEASPQ